MLIGKLSELTELSKDTIRFYEKQGLIAARNGSPGKGRFKIYGDETVQRLVFIKKAKQLGFTLGQIKQEIDAWASGELSWDEKIEIVQRQVTLLDEQLFQLQKTRQQLQESVKYLKECKAKALKQCVTFSEFPMVSPQAAPADEPQSTDASDVRAAHSCYSNPQ